MNDFFGEALRRITRFTLAAGLLGFVAAFLLRGPLFAAGVLVGAAISVLNFRWLKGLVESLGDSGKKPVSGSAVFLVLRYLMAALIVYVIVRFTKVAVVSVLVGLLANVPAILLEVLYELVFLKET